MHNKQANLIDPEIEAKIDLLLAQMTLEEKAGQLAQLGPESFGGFDLDAFLENPDPEAFKNIKRNYHEDAIRLGTVGSLTGVQGAELVNRLQRIAVEESRLGIPLLFGLDVIHGLRTIFPIPLGEACSWEPDLARRTAEAAGREAAATGVNWTLAPMVDIGRDARWGRVAEGAGEDPFLGGAFAAARVLGFQGDDLSDPERVIACAKHYIAYGGASAGRDYNTVELAWETLFEIYLPPFAAAARAGLAAFMSSFNDLNGVPASANRFTLTDVLRGRLGFNGLVISDWNSIGELITHGYAEDRRDAGMKALLAGVDMDMATDAYRLDLPGLVRQGLVPGAALDQAVRRVLRIKFLMGLFERPYRTDPDRESRTILRPEFIALARDAARRSIVLLKNENGLLPLRKDLKKIAVVGPLAEDAKDMLGSWSFTGLPKDVVTILSGFQAAVEPGTEVVYAKGCEINRAVEEDFSEALAAARGADVVVAAVGESAMMSGEASSRMELGLPGNQLALLGELQKTGVPLVVLLVNGRPLAIPWIDRNAAAVLETWQLGVQAGPAIADVLFGDYNPSGKLVSSFPYAVGQSPIYYNRTRTGRPATEQKFTSRYIDGPVDPLYPFGFGLSYAAYAYSDLEVTPAQVALDGVLKVSAVITNTGARAGEEIVQLYVADRIASRVRPVKELKGFKKIALQPGESQRVSFDLQAADLGFYNQALDYVVEPGRFKVWVGPNSRQGLEGEFEVV